MALPLGKLTILIGAGVLGSIWAKEGRMPIVPDFFSSALQIALKPLKKSDSAPSAGKPRNDALLAQVNNLRQELQLLASSGPVTIVTSRTAGGRRYGVIIVIVVLGYGYVWWKGWKLPDFFFATKRGFKDACDSVSKELDKVFHSVKVTRNQVSSKIDESSFKFDDIVACTSTTKDEVSDVRVKVSKFKGDIQAVTRQIHTLETKMGKIQGTQDETKEGVAKLLLCTLDGDNRLNGLIQFLVNICLMSGKIYVCLALQQPGNFLVDIQKDSSSRPALESPRITSSTRTVSLPAGLPLEPPSPSTSMPPSPSSSNGSHVGYQIPGSVKNIPNAAVSEITEQPSTPDLSPREPVRSAGLLSRTISATLNFKFR